MNKIFLFFLLLLLFLYCGSASLSQIDNSSIANVPEGGFDTRIDGIWDCGSYGTMKLIQQGTSVFGDYTYKNGTVLGFYSEGIYKGKWKQPDHEGEFIFQVSTERKTPRPTHLRGKWNTGEGTKWFDDWICER